MHHRAGVENPAEVRQPARRPWRATMKSSDAASIAMSVTRAPRSARVESTARDRAAARRAAASGPARAARGDRDRRRRDRTSSERPDHATRRAGRSPRPGRAAGSSTDAATPGSPRPASSPSPWRASSTRENVDRLAHISAAPPPTTSAPSQASTPTLNHAGENTSRASS